MRALNFRKLKFFDLLMILLGAGVVVLGLRILTVDKQCLGKGYSWAVVYVRLNNQPVWVDEAIKIGDKELQGKREVAEILEKHSVLTQAEKDYEVRFTKHFRTGKAQTLAVDLPVYKENLDISLKVNVLAKKNPYLGLGFKDYKLKVNETIEIETENIVISGIITRLEK